jgi:SAM-dependent methyltransferase
MPTATVAAALKSGAALSDRTFDQMFPPPLRFVSHQHWTPVQTARRAAQLFVEVGATRILDVGSGTGKFCIVGALTTNASFTGVERREELVVTARAVSERLGATRARFIQSDVLRLAFRDYDGFYLFNPFYEHVNRYLPQIDDTVSHSPRLYKRLVATTSGRLSRLRVGVAVVTYHGFGGTMPATFRRVHEEEAGNDRLALWVKVRS